jgi:hypothetical protein
LRVLLAGLGTLLVAAPGLVLAHHSTAMFDQLRPCALSGVVKEFRWINPHALIQVLVKTDDRREETWEVELSTPRYLAKVGWTPGTLHAGDAVNLVVQPMRDGSKMGAFVSGAGPPGALVNEPPTAPANAQPSCTAP